MMRVNNITEFLVLDEEFHQYLNKILEIKARSPELWKKFKNTLNEISFEKTLENYSNILKAKIFFDMEDFILWFFELYEKSYYESSWRNTDLFYNFNRNLPSSFEEWVVCAKEVLEDPDILRIFVDIENQIKVTPTTIDPKTLEAIQNYVDTSDEEDFYKLLQSIENELTSKLKET